MARFNKKNGQYVIHGKRYPEITGSRAKVWHGTAYETPGGLPKSKLMMNKKGHIVSRKKYLTAKKEMRLVKHGYGTLSFHNGDVYKGEFRNDARHGRGTYLFATGARYIGEFQAGKRHGRGRYTYEDGREYIGEFREGRRVGPGFAVPSDQSQAGADGGHGGEG